MLDGLKDHLLTPDLIAIFIEEYRKGWNRLAATKNAAEASRKAELTRIERQIANMIEAIKAGLFQPAMKEEMEKLEARKLELAADPVTHDPDPVLLHPGMVERYRSKVSDLIDALNAEGTRDEAAAIIRSLIETIRLIPEDGGLVIERVGELAGILALGQESKRPPGGELTP